MGTGISVGLSPGRTNGWRYPFALTFFSQDLHSQNGVEFASVRTRALVGGIGYGWHFGRLGPGVQVQTGYAWNHGSLNEDLEAAFGVPKGTVWLNAGDSWLVRPEIKAEYFITPKITVRVSGDYVYCETAHRRHDAQPAIRRRVAGKQPAREFRYRVLSIPTTVALSAFAHTVAAIVLVAIVFRMAVTRQGRGGRRARCRERRHRSTSVRFSVSDAEHVEAERQCGRSRHGVVRGHYRQRAQTITPEQRHQRVLISHVGIFVVMVCLDPRNALLYGVTFQVTQNTARRFPMDYFVWSRDLDPSISDAIVGPLAFTESNCRRPRRRRAHPTR